MGLHAAIAIGVGKVPHMELDPVPGACRGARRFHAWAESQKFHPTKLLVDDKKPVERREIEKWVRTIVDRSQNDRVVDELFIYFAGHGIDKGISDSVWLLSHAGTERREAIDVAESFDLALLYSLIPHVVFLGDTCRTRVESDVSSEAIFPLPKKYDEMRTIRADVFYAAYPGQASHENADDPRCVGIHTHCLLQALEGRAPDAIIDTPQSTARASQAVTATTLEKYLEEAVPSYALETLRVYQRPYSIPHSIWRPHVMAWIDPNEYPPPSPEEPEPTNPPADRPGSDHDEPPAVPSGEPPVPPGDKNPELKEIEKNLLAARWANGAPGVALSVSGDRSAMVNGAPYDRDRNLYAELRSPRTSINRLVHDGNSSWRLHGLRESFQGPALIHLDSLWGKRPLWSAIAIFQGFTTEIRVDNFGVQHLAYLDNRGTTDVELVARMTARARLGAFSPEDNAAMLRSLETHFDPVLAILLAYSLHRFGLMGEVRNLLHSLRERRLPVPFDVALLADHALPSEGDVVPGFPLVARGWTVLGYSQGGAKALANMAAPHLAPAYWTTLFEPSRKLRENLLLGDP
ncbi:caspase family protein [Streptomyces lavendulae]|uniref:caspase family protein n=1 Tax=Streptomyces lavendulae TaxID=1914 RepID=UPI0033C46E31